jgi:hypothetical protein
MRAAAFALTVAGLALLGNGRALAQSETIADPSTLPALPINRERPVRFSAALLAGTGYGWKDGYGDVNADVPFPGGKWAALGHVSPEIALLFPRARLFASLALRYQVITGTTDIYAGGDRVYHARKSAKALFQKVGWFPRSAEARLQPYLALGSGRGTIAQRGSVPSLQNCGPLHNQECVDTVGLGPWFAVAGVGMRARLANHLDAVAAIDAQLGFDGALDDRGYNLDVSFGMAAVF